MGTAILAPTRFSGSGRSAGDEEVEANDDEESIMEFERPGEEKKNRLEAKTEAKSGVTVPDSSDSESDEQSSSAAAATDLALVVHSNAKS